MINCDCLDLKNYLLNWQTSYLRLAAQFKQDQKIMCLFPLTSLDTFSLAFPWLSHSVMGFHVFSSPCWWKFSVFIQIQLCQLVWKQHRFNVTLQTCSNLKISPDSPSAWGQEDTEWILSLGWSVRLITAEQVFGESRRGHTLSFSCSFKQL